MYPPDLQRTPILLTSSVIQESKKTGKSEEKRKIVMLLQYKHSVIESIKMLPQILSFSEPLHQHFAINLKKRFLIDPDYQRKAADTVFQEVNLSEKMSVCIKYNKILKIGNIKLPNPFWVPFCCLLILGESELADVWCSTSLKKSTSFCSGVVTDPPS